MKKILENLGFAILCIVLFMVSALVAFNLRKDAIIRAPYRYVSVSNNDAVWRVEHNLESSAGTKYDLYLPADMEDRDYSLIFFIHGGGFTSGDKEEGAQLLPYYASKGIIGVSANYSLASEENPVTLNEMLAELNTTISESILYCKSLGYNITEMATSGVSAGGCLAMLTAYRDMNKLPVPVRFVFQQVGPATMEPVKWNFIELQDQADFVNKMAGGNFTVDDIGSEEYNAAMNSISPAAWVNESTVPTLMAYGPRDVIVPPNLKYSLIEKFDEYGVIYMYIEFPNSGHGLLNDLDKSDEYFKAVDEYIEKYFVN